MVNPIVASQRAWCLWELYSTVVAGVDFSIAFSPDQLAALQLDIWANGAVAVTNRLASINVHSANGRREDVEMIQQAARGLCSDQHERLSGFEMLDHVFGTSMLAVFREKLTDFEPCVATAWSGRKLGHTSSRPDRKEGT